MARLIVQCGISRNDESDFAQARRNARRTSRMRMHFRCVIWNPAGRDVLERILQRDDMSAGSGGSLHQSRSVVALRNPRPSIGQPVVVTASGP